MYRADYCLKQFKLVFFYSFFYSVGKKVFILLTSITIGKKHEAREKNPWEKGRAYF